MQYIHSQNKSEDFLINKVVLAKVEARTHNLFL